MSHPCLACHGTGCEPGYHAAGPMRCHVCHGTGVHKDSDPEVCPVCEGTGFSATFTEHGAEICWYCHGAGSMPHEHVRAGVRR